MEQEDFGQLCLGDFQITNKVCSGPSSNEQSEMMVLISFWKQATFSIERNPNPLPVEVALPPPQGLVDTTKGFGRDGLKGWERGKDPAYKKDSAKLQILYTS